MNAEPGDLDVSQLAGQIDPRNKLNDLTASEWITRTVSVMVQKGLGKGSKEAQIERQHPAPFSYQDVARFIEFFTKRGETVLDPFSGVGSTSKAAASVGRNSTGFELNPTFFDLTRKRLETEVSPELLAATRHDIMLGDARSLAKELPENSIDFIVTSPPYWGILNKIDHKAKQERLQNGLSHNYGETEADLAHIEDYDDFLSEIGQLFFDLSRALKPKKYAVVIVGDFRNKDRYYLFHSDLSRRIEELGPYTLKGVTIIYQKFKRVFPYGYPFAFVPNIHHQYAMILQRQDD